MLPLFNAGLANIKASGEYDAIYEKWIGEKPAAAGGRGTGGWGNRAVVTDTSYAAVNCDYGGIIKSIEAVDELTVKFTLCKPDGLPVESRLLRLPDSTVGIPRKHRGGGTALTENPVGTGPYKLERWQRAVRSS